MVGVRHSLDTNIHIVRIRVATPVVVPQEIRHAPGCP